MQAVGVCVINGEAKCVSFQQRDTCMVFCLRKIEVSVLNLDK